MCVAFRPIADEPERHFKHILQTENSFNNRPCWKYVREYNNYMRKEFANQTRRTVVDFKADEFDRARTSFLFGAGSEVSFRKQAPQTLPESPASISSQNRSSMSNITQTKRIKKPKQPSGEIKFL